MAASVKKITDKFRNPGLVSRIFLRVTRPGVFLPALLISAAWAFFIHYEELKAPYKVYGDISYFYVVHGINDPELFRVDDPLLRFIRKENRFYGSLGPFPRFLLRPQAACAKLLGLPDFLKYSSVLLQILSSLIAFRILLLFSDKLRALIFLAVFNVFFSSLDTFWGGLHRAYAAPVLLSIYYYLCLGRLAHLLALLPLLYIFYPVTLPSAILMSALAVDRHGGGKKKLWFGLLAALLAAMLAVSYRALDFTFLAARDAAYSWLPDPGSRLLSTLSTFFNFGEHTVPYALLTALFALLLILAVGAEKKRLEVLPGEKIFFGASLFAFALFSLAGEHGIASRQLILSLPIFLVFQAHKALLSAAGKKNALALCAGIIILAAMFRSDFSGLMDYGRYAAAFKKIDGYPKETIVITHPEVSDFVPFFTRRGTFFHSNWGTIPYVSHEPAAKRWEELFRIIYATSTRNLSAFTGKNYLFLVDENFYTAGPQRTVALNAGQSRRDADGIPAAEETDYTLLTAARRYGAALPGGIYLLPGPSLPQDKRLLRGSIKQR